MYICNVCNEKFDRSYKLKRHAFVGDHKGNRKEIKLKSENDGTRIQSLNVVGQSPFVVQQNGRKTSYPIKKEEPVTQPLPPHQQKNGHLNGAVKRSRNNQKTPSQITSLSSKSQLNQNSYSSFQKTKLPEEKVFIIKIPPMISPPIMAPNKLKTESMDRKSTEPVKIKIEDGKLQSVETSNHQVIKEEYQKFNKDTEHEWSQIIYQMGSDEEAVFKCTVCSEHFCALSAIDDHLQVHNGFPYSYTCELCDEQFSLAAHLKNHVIGHTQCTYRFECDHCQKRFATEFHRQTHIVNDKCLYQELTQMFSCNKCRQTYLNESLYLSHLYEHSGKKPYKCDICETEFIHLSALTKHRECDTTCEYSSENGK